MTLSDGSCAQVGIPAEDCAAGFVAGDAACEPVLPAEPCPAGTMALPGDEVCRPVMECPAEPWVGVDLGASPQFVDAGYAGGGSDGSAASPWTTIGEAVLAASSGSVIAIAPGTYPEDLSFTKQLHLVGTCPSEVAIVGQTAEAPAVVIATEGASGSSLVGLAVTGSGIGVGLSDVLDVTLDRVWVHDTASAGVDVEDALGPASVIVIDSLVEGVGERGVAVIGAEATVIRSAIRSNAGRGIAATVSSWGTDAPSAVTVEGCHLSANVGPGLFVSGSPGRVSGSVIRTSVAGEGDAGRGISVQTHLASGQLVSLEVEQSAILDNESVGIIGFGATMRVASTLVRGTRTDPAATGPTAVARGLVAQADPGIGVDVTIVDSTFRQQQGIGVVIAGGTAAMERLLVQDNADPLFGASEGLLVRPGPMGEPTAASLVASRLERLGEAGILMGESDLTVEDCVIREVVPNADGLVGDGINTLFDTANLALRRSLLANNARAGLAVFGGSATLADNRFLCHAFALAKEDAGGDATLIDEGGNVCGCDGDEDICQAVSAGISPPSLPDVTSPM